MIRILIVEDQKIMQKYFEYLIESNKEFQHVQTIADANDAIKVCNSTKVDLVLMDVQTFHNHDGLAAGKEIREAHPKTKVLIITSLIDPEVLARAKTGCADSLSIKITEMRKFLMSFIRHWKGKGYFRTFPRMFS
ncbi:MAG: response regulator transcription factor [Mediterraneibacter faecis]